MNRLAVRLTLWVFATWLGMGLGAVPAAGDDLPEVESVEIRGTDAISDGRLKSIMRTRSPSFWRPFRSTPYRGDVLRLDLRRIEDYYRNHGFLEATATLTDVQTAENQNTVRIVITVDEGQTTVVESIDFPGLRYLDRREVLETIRTRPGEPFSPAQSALDATVIQGMFADRGRPFSTVRDSVQIEDRRARVSFMIRPAAATRIGDIHVEGTDATKDFVVWRELQFGPGDLLERDRMLESREGLMQTGFFRNVRFQTVGRDSVLARRLVDMYVLVDERKMGWVEAGIGYNSAKQHRLGGEVGHRNVLGNAHRVSVDGRIDLDVEGIFKGTRRVREANLLGINLQEPRLFSTRTTGTLRLFQQFSREAEILDVGVAEEETKGISLSATRRRLGQPVRFRTTLEHRWITQQLSIDDPSTSTVLQDFTERKLETLSLSFLFEHDLRNNVFDPSRGALQSLLAEFAGGTTSYMKWSATTSWYGTLTSGLVVAGRFRAGWIHPFDVQPGEIALAQVPREARFRAGGATTVRGYPEDSLGPQIIAEDGQRNPVTFRGLVTMVANVEVRFPLLWLLSGAVFLDSGQVWENAKAFSLSKFIPGDPPADDDYRYSIGAGIRLGTPVGPLRLDYGYGLVRGRPETLVQATSGGEWHFSLGQAF